MAGFKNRCLNILDALYGFVSEKTYTNQLNLDVPITLVHDTSREAELGSGLGSEGGYFWLQYNQGVGAGTTYRYRDSIYDSVASIPAWGVPVAEQYRIWFIGPVVMDGNLNLANKITTAAFSLEFPTDSMEFIRTYTLYLPVAYFENDQGLFTDSTAAASRYVSLPIGTGLYWPKPSPVMCPIGTCFTWEIVTTGAAAGGANIHAQYWIGKKGTTPPGMR